MIAITSFKLSKDLLNEAIHAMPIFSDRLALNKPTNQFFHDPWEIKDQFKNTVWEKVLDSLAVPKGEARLIKLPTKSCYTGHADIDDRWHLTLVSQKSYLIDLDTDTMYNTNDSGCWYNMDASKRHTAANFGNDDRIQLVVRHLLPIVNLKDPVTISIEDNPKEEESRYIFDDVVSPRLNILSKEKLISNISATVNSITFDIERSASQQLIDLVSTTPLILK
jgi:hypothetical protein